MSLIFLAQLVLGFGVDTSCPSAAARAARELYSRGDTTGAIAAVADVEVCADGSDEELAEAFRWRAQAKAVAGDVKGAIDAFAMAWTVLPTWVLDPLESPKFHDQYAEGRKRALQTRLVFARFTRTLVGHVVVQVYDPHGRVKRLHVVFDQMEMSATRHDDGTWHALVPAGALSATAVLESVEAIVFKSRTVSIAGLPVPVEERLTSAPPARSRQKAWVIGGVIAGVVVVAAAVVTGVVLANRHVDGTLGRVELP
ncbi:MAG: hypothetical protein IPJ65_31900 [Archangiaceae bacterium]|nr:hypothetical protein [Archangiaceae bacterium]